MVTPKWDPGPDGAGDMARLSNKAGIAPTVASGKVVAGDPE